MAQPLEDKIVQRAVGILLNEICQRERGFPATCMLPRWHRVQQASEQVCDS